MHKAGFVNIFGKPNAGKSTLLNALAGEKLAIISPKVQTTRHRIIGILQQEDYQIVFSDTPGIISPKYKLQEKMMHAMKSALEDTDVALFVADVRDSAEEIIMLFSDLKLKVPSLLVVNKMELLSEEKLKEVTAEYSSKNIFKDIIAISALEKINLDKLLQSILHYLPEAENFYPDGTLTDRPTRFFAAELIREKIFKLLEEEIPYHAAVVITQFQEKTTLTKITAEIIVTRESQKAILLGEKGKMIKQLGTLARQDIEKFLERKVFLELFVKVRNKWRDNENFLREYGYNDR